jgi:hypothetical protein
MRPAATRKYRLAVIFFVDFGLGWKQDQRVETATALLAVPNMTGALIAPVLRPFGGDQLTTALNAFHPDQTAKTSKGRLVVTLPKTPGARKPEIKIAVKAD